MSTDEYLMHVNYQERRNVLVITYLFFQISLNEKHTLYSINWKGISYIPNDYGDSRG